jgi:hypothetical protein
MKQTNTAAVGAMAAVQHVKHYWAQIQIDAQADFELPASKRGITRKVRAGCVTQQRAPEGYWDSLSNEAISAALDRGVASAKSWLQDKCKFNLELDLSKRSQFFSAPCLHFPKMESFKDCAAALDNGNNGSGGDGNNSGNDGGNGNNAVPAAPAEAPVVARRSQRASVSADRLFRAWRVSASSDAVAEPEVAPCGEEEVAPPGEDADTDVAAVVEDLFAEHYHGVTNGTADEEWKQMSRLMADFNAGKINKGMQEHRKWRFVGQKLFDASQKKVEQRRKKRGVWDVVMLNYDVAVQLDVEVKQGRRTVVKKIWRVGNVEGIRVLKKDPGKGDTVRESLGNEETESYPRMVSVDDPKAVFAVRWYRECDDGANILDGYQHPAGGVKFYLPMQGDSVAEPVVEITNHSVIESVQMKKDESRRGVWLLDPENRELTEEKFNE